MWSALVLGIWLLIQPWLVWPNLYAETSHRLTLVVCCVALGLLRLGDRAIHHPLPRGVAWWIVGCVGILVCHHLHLIRDSTYFQFFQETALFADGLCDVIVLTWGLWAVCQVPATWWREIRWVGVAMLSLNLLFIVAQGAGRHWFLGSFPQPPETQTVVGVSGLMGLDRLLGAYGVAWLPVCFAWSPWLALLPISVIAASGKVTAWIGAAVAVILMRPRWTPMLLPLALVAILCWTDGSLTKKIPLRVGTWTAAVRATRDHPWIGAGLSPLAAPTARATHQSPLPSFHSDWLALAFHFGWPLALWAGWGVRSLCRPPVTPLSRALRASLIALAVMSLGQATLSHARIAGLALVLVAWFWQEQRRGAAI